MSEFILFPLFLPFYFCILVLPEVLFLPSSKRGVLGVFLQVIFCILSLNRFIYS